MLSTTLLRAVVSFSVVIVSLASVLPQRDVADKQSFDARDDIPSVDARACRYGCGPHTTTPDGSCGPTSAGYYACRAGYCCSEWGWCGATPAHCGAGCFSEFGTCGITPPNPPKPVQISTDGSCGPSSAGNYTCPAGNCCSSWGYCGATSAHCSNCQKGYGRC